MNNIYGLFIRLMERCRFFFMSCEEYARYKGVSIGKDCRILNKHWGTEPFLISIGDRVTITGSVTFLNHDGSTWLVRDIDGTRYYKYGRISIGSDVFIGVNAIIMPGVTIGSKVVIGAGALVTKNIPDNSVAIGCPAKVIASFDEFKRKIRKNHVNEKDLQECSGFKSKVYKAIELDRLKNI